jgi:hypothetical protein
MLEIRASKIWLYGVVHIQVSEKHDHVQKTLTVNHLPSWINGNKQTSNAVAVAMKINI